MSKTLLTRSPQLPGIAMIVLQSLLYGILDPLAKRAFETAPVFLYLTIRYTLATAALLLLFGRRILPELRTVPPRRYLLPAFCIAAAFLCSNLALRYTSATNMAFLRTLSALLAPLLLRVFYGRRSTRLELCLYAAVAVGSYLLCIRGGMGRFGLGEALSLLSALLGAAALVFGRETLRHIRAETLSCVQAACSILLCVPMALLSGHYAAGLAPITPPVAATIVYAALGCTVSGYLLQNHALKYASAKTVGLVQCLYPVMTALGAFVLLDERVGAAGLAGAAIIIACVALEGLFGDRPAAAKEDGDAP